MSEFIELDLVENIVTAIVSNPEEIEIVREVDDIGTRIDVKVAKADLGILIGKEGKTVQAIRTILRTIGAKTNQRISLRVIE